MKYYLSEYWIMMNSNNPAIREEGKIKWIETAKKYGPYFETIRDKLPKGFVKEFDKNSWFHDFSIENITITSSRNNTAVIELIISHGEIVYNIVFSGIKGLEINIPSTLGLMGGMLTWGYSEFELNDNNTWTIRVLCDLECEVEIIFQHLSIEKLL